MFSSKRIGIIAYNVVTESEEWFGDASGNMGFITFYDFINRVYFFYIYSVISKKYNRRIRGIISYNNTDSGNIFNWHIFFG